MCLRDRCVSVCVCYLCVQKGSKYFKVVSDRLTLVVDLHGTILFGGPLRTQFDDVICWVDCLLDGSCFPVFFSNSSIYFPSHSDDCISSSALQCDPFYFQTWWLCCVLQLLCSMFPLFLPRRRLRNLYSLVGIQHCSCLPLSFQRVCNRVLKILWSYRSICFLITKL